jgi:hypothetical protein
MPFVQRATSSLAALFLAAACALLAHDQPAFASSTQQTIFQDDTFLKADPAGTLQTLQELGVDRVRVFVTWASIAPSPDSASKPKGFDATNPDSYPAKGWSVYDQIVQDAQADGITVDFTPTAPVPRWAMGPGVPNSTTRTWKPSPHEFQSFVHAVGTRYSGTYTPLNSLTPLPRVNFWAIWNEPNYGPDLAPQATNGDTVEVGAVQYRALLNAAWNGLNSSGHGHDTLLIGETAPRGLNHPIGVFGGVKAIRFVRALYCMGTNLQPLRGAAATARSCPTTNSGTAAFRSQNPGLFQVTGLADHPYSQGRGPVAAFPGPVPDPDYADFINLPRLESTLDTIFRRYGSSKRLPVWNTEYGLWTNPPNTYTFNSPDTVSYYINWTEYLSWRSSRIQSFMQYLLVDPIMKNFASGLEFWPGNKKKSTYSAFRLPLYLPVTSARKNTGLEVWGAARPAKFYGGSVKVQFQAGSRGPFTTLTTLTPSNSEQYFDTRIKFATSGTVRLAYTFPTSPPSSTSVNPFLQAPGNVAGATVYSRLVTITLK